MKNLHEKCIHIPWINESKYMSEWTPDTRGIAWLFNISLQRECKKERSSKNRLYFDGISTEPSGRILPERFEIQYWRAVLNVHKRELHVLLWLQLTLFYSAIAMICHVYWMEGVMHAFYCQQLWQKPNKVQQ